MDRLFQKVIFLVILSRWEAAAQFWLVAQRHQTSPDFFVKKKNVEFGITWIIINARTYIVKIIWTISYTFFD